MTHEDLCRIAAAYRQDGPSARAARDALLLSLSRHVEPVHVFHEAMILLTEGRAGHKALKHLAAIEALGGRHDELLRVRP